MIKNNVFNTNCANKLYTALPEYQATSFINKLSHAIRYDELCLHYQPRYNALSGKVDVLEALVRWRCPDNKLLYPNVFIPQAEKNGLISRLDLWVFRHCCEDLLWLRKNRHPQVKVSINISVHVCEDIGFLQEIIKISDCYGIHISNFEFDITGCAHVHDIQCMTSFCEALDNFGVNFSLDDFSVGPSPVEKLWRLAKTTIINKDFIHGIGQSKNAEALIQSLVCMAKKIQVQVIAEGIESNEQRLFMSELGCEHLQGYLFCRPQSVNQIKPSMLFETGL